MLASPQSNGRFALTDNDFLEAERSLCRRSLAHFIKRAWPLLEPETPLKWGWALDAMCLHLEAVTRGYTNRLLMNVPPATMKSLLTSVFWPAWEWGPMGMPHMRFVSTSHTVTLAERDNIKNRTLIKSEWYQSLWPIKLIKDTDANIENTATGFRQAMAFTKMTGKRGDRVILDDPLSADDANSAAILQATEYAFRETLPTRLNDQKKSAVVVIMQRLHELDPSGIIIRDDLPFTKLILPMEYEPDRHCETWLGNHRFFSDPRTEPGQLLFPERYDRADVEALKKTMGSYATAGQLQQRPAPRGGGIIKRAWFEVVGAAPVGVRWVRGWDLAGTAKKTSPFTAGVKMGIGNDGTFYIANVAREQIDAALVRKFIKNVATQDGWQVHISIPQDPGQAGKSQVIDFAKDLAGWNVHFSPESGEKLVRALPFAAQAEAGNVKLVAGEWVEPFLDEVSSFPTGQFKDQVDAASRAFSYLLEMKSYPLEEAM